MYCKKLQAPATTTYYVYREPCSCTNRHSPRCLDQCPEWRFAVGGSLEWVSSCYHWSFFWYLSKSLSLSVEGCSGQKRVVLPPWPPWRRRPWLFKSPRIDTRNWWWVAICRKKSLLLTCTRDSQGFSATLPSSNFWWKRCSRNEISWEKQNQTYYCM